MVVTLFLSLEGDEQVIAEDDPLFASPDAPELWLVLVTVETVTAPRPPSLFPSMSPHTYPEDMLEDAPAAADLKPASVPKASEPPSPESASEDVPTLVILTPLEPLFALAPPAPVAWKLLLDVITAELLVPPEPPDAALPPDPPALRKKSPKGKK